MAYRIEVASEYDENDKIIAWTVASIQGTQKFNPGAAVGLSREEAEKQVAIWNSYSTPTEVRIVEEA